MINQIYIVSGIILFILLLLVLQSRSIENQFMTGFWKADIEFCETADLELFMLYLGSNVGYTNNIRYGYILAKNEEGIILNNPIKITFDGFSLMPGLASNKNYKVSIDWQETEHSDDTFPSELSATYYPAFQKIVFYTGDIVHAILYKDSVLSAINTDSIPDAVKLNNADNVDNEIGEEL